MSKNLIIPDELEKGKTSKVYPLFANPRQERDVRQPTVVSNQDRKDLSCELASFLRKAISPEPRGNRATLEGSSNRIRSAGHSTQRSPSFTSNMGLGHNPGKRRGNHFQEMREKNPLDIRLLYPIRGIPANSGTQGLVFTN